MATVFTLAAAQGGTKFGPFQAATVHVGTDAHRAEVTLPAWPDIAPIHCAVTETPTGWMVSPFERGLPMFVYRDNHYWQVVDAVPVNPGDILVIGQQNGAALTLTKQPVAVSRPQGGGAGRGKLPSGGAMASEMRRQAEASLMTKGPLQDIRRFLYQYQSGALLRPRNLIAAGAALLMMLGTGFISCLGVIGSLLWGS